MAAAFDDDVQTRWAEAVGRHLFAGLELRIGGDTEPRWYCRACGSDHGTDGHPKVCRRDVKRWRLDWTEEIYERHLRHLMGDAEWSDAQDQFCRCLSCRDWEPQDPCDKQPTVTDCIASHFVTYESYKCNGVEFERKQQEGHLIDRITSDYMHMYNELVAARLLETLEGQ